MGVNSERNIVLAVLRLLPLLCKKSRSEARLQRVIISQKPVWKHEQTDTYLLYLKAKNENSSRKEKSIQS